MGKRVAEPLPPALMCPSVMSRPGGKVEGYHKLLSHSVADGPCQFPGCTWMWWNDERPHWPSPSECPPQKKKKKSTLKKERRHISIPVSLGDSYSLHFCGVP